MKYYHQVWQWIDGGANDLNWTKNCTAPIFIEDRLDETLDTAQITLDAVPIDYKEPFPPKTKFRIERYLQDPDNIKNQVPQKTWDFVVDHDDVEIHIGCPTICTHRIHLIEPSVICQGMHCDNIALTYELNDVDLNYRTTIETNDTVDSMDLISVSSQGWTSPVHQVQTADIYQNNWYDDQSRTLYFRNSYRYVWEDGALDTIKNLLANIDGTITNTVTFTVPKLFCQGSYDNTQWSNLFELRTQTIVYQRKMYNGQFAGQSVTKIVKQNMSQPTSNNDAVWQSANSGLYSYARSIREGNEQANAAPDGNWVYDRGIHTTHEVHADWFTDQSNWTTLPYTGTHNTETVYQDYTATFETDTLTQQEIDAGYYFEYEITVKPYFSGVGWSLPIYVDIKNDVTKYISSFGTKLYYLQNVSINQIINANVADISIEAKFIAGNLTDGQLLPFLRRGVKYNAYDLLRRALLTTQTYLIDNATTSLDELDGQSPPQPQPSLPHSIIVDESWMTKLKATTVFETIFEGKNLWEVLLQIGYYLHAIPYLEFATDGTDRFVLKFRQLGDTRVKQDVSQKITVFTSKNLQDYFTQYDSYVTNLFSPQNVVEEWLVPKTSDSSYLVFNDVAELQTNKPILEILELYVTYDGSAGGVSGTTSILKYIFENSVYTILTNDDPTRIIPAKGNSIYYNLGDNKILGLNYVPPEAQSGTFAYALQEIVRREFNTGAISLIPQNLKYNSLLFRIKYRTQDSLRVSQVRPDIARFMKNSSYETYPHHEQFYGQQDKIVDSERFSANLYGRLIRVGNNVYQAQEYCPNPIVEKEAGDLVVIENEPYYVTTVENELYQEAILQKVTYSKNFNQLSNIVTIPSEPRFYEVSERSKIRREVRIMEFFELSTSDDGDGSFPLFIPSTTWQDFIKSLIFTKEKTLPNFAYTKFMADKLRRHASATGGVINPNNLFPSSLIDRTTEPVTPLPSTDSADNIVPLLHYPLHDGIVFEWDMYDNFKAGDYIDTEINGYTGDPTNGAYYALQSVRYCDIFGRADLFRFSLFYKTDWTDIEVVQNLPLATIDVREYEIIGVQGSDTMAIALDKDNREELSFNYQINLTHKNQDGDDDFITYPNLFGDKDGDFTCCLSNQRQSQFSDTVNLGQGYILADNVPFTFSTSTNRSIQISFDADSIVWETINGVQSDVSMVQSIIMYTFNSDTNNRAVYIAKNVDKLANSDKLQNWYIYPVFNK